MNEDTDRADVLSVEKLEEYLEGIDNPIHKIMSSAKGMRISQVDVNELEMSEYQRITENWYVERLARKFDPIRAGVITVSERDNQLFIIDGATRVTVMRRLQIPFCPAMILMGLTLEQEAEYFRTQGQNTRRVTSYERFHAGIIAKDPECIAIDRIIKMHGFTMSGPTKSAGKLTAVFAVTQIYRRFGGSVLDNTLMLIRETWGGHEFVTKSECLMGVAEFVYRFGTLDFVERFANVQFVQLSQIYQMYRGGTSNSLAFCKALVQRYNDSLHGGKKKLVMDLAS